MCNGWWGGGAPRAQEHAADAELEVVRLELGHLRREAGADLHDEERRGERGVKRGVKGGVAGRGVTSASSSQNCAGSSSATPGTVHSCDWYL